MCQPQSPGGSGVSRVLNSHQALYLADLKLEGLHGIDGAGLPMGQNRFAPAKSSFVLDTLKINIKVDFEPLVPIIYIFNSSIIAGRPW